MDINRELLYRFFENNASLSEEEHIRQWIESAEENYLIFLREREEYNTLQLTSSPSLKRTTPFSFLRVSAVAAVFLLLILSGLYLLNTNKTKTTEEFHILLVPFGQRANLILPDRSSVWLNGGSTLRYPVKFTKKNRTVYLDGEAYFKVSADKSRRFNVIAGNGMVVSAFGTEFNVAAYSQADEPYRVLLARGNVELSFLQAERRLKLKPGEEAVVLPKTGQIEVSPADIYVQTAWKDGKMVFYRQKLGDIATILSKRFGLNIHFADDDLKEQTYTGTFTTEGITEILDLFKKSAPIDYTMVTQEADNRTEERKRSVLIKWK